MKVGLFRNFALLWAGFFSLPLVFPTVLGSDGVEIQICIGVGCFFASISIWNKTRTFTIVRPPFHDILFLLLIPILARILFVRLFGYGNPLWSPFVALGVLLFMIVLASYMDSETVLMNRRRRFGPWGGSPYAV